MKNFHFSLETVLSYKQQILENVRQDVALISNRLDQIIQEEGQKQRDYDEKKQCFIEKQQAGTTTQMMLYCNNFLYELREEQKSLALKHKALQKEHSAAIVRLTNIKIEVSALEKLQNKELRQHKAEVAKEEECLIEEFVVHEQLVNGR